MRYNWDKQTIHKICKDPEVKREMQGMFDPFYDVKNSLYKPRTPLKKKIELDSLMIKDQKYLKKPVKKVHKAYPIGTRATEPINNLNFTNTDLLDFAHDFYKQFDKELFKVFLKIYKQRFTHLKFIRKTDKFSNPTTYYSHKAKQTFIKSSNHHDVRSITDLIHEYAHAISCNYNNHPIEHTPFTEIESIFPNLVAYDFLEKNLKLENHVNYARAIEFNAAMSYINSLYYKFEILDIIKKFCKDDKVTKDDLEMIKGIVLLNEEDLRSTYELDSINANPYVLGYLSGFELYSMYQDDPEYTVFLYKYLLSELSDADANMNWFNTSTSYERHNINIIKEYLDLGNNVDSFVRKIKRD